MMRSLLLLLLLIPKTRADEAHFRERVAPVLKKRCVECHNAVKSRGGLDLSSRIALLKGGDTGPGIVEGKSAKSLLIEQVTGTKPAMPRKGDPLSAQEVADLRKWIDGGANWPSTIKLQDADSKPIVDANWWSLRPLVKAAPRGDGNPIDLFIVSRLKQEGLSPVPEADRPTLIRRLYFNLHGLPPTPEEMTQARNDKQEDWYEKLIDRLLESPRYGERWGRHWLDVVHYADTHGYDKDKRRDNAWPYRDYVIKSFNDDKPYPQFVREQLASDVLSKGENVVPTGFIAAGPWDFVGHVELREGTVDKMKTRLIDRDDMLSSTMSTFVSMTVHCARCHDHKFDPIAQTDYYRLQAVFAGIDRGDRPYRRTISPEQKALETKKVQLVAESERLKAIVAKIPALKQQEETLRKLRVELAALPKPKGAGPSPSNGWHSGITATPDVTKWVQVDLGQSLPLDEIRLLPARPTDFRDAPGFGFPVRFRVSVSDDPTFARAEHVVNYDDLDYPNPGETPVRLRPENKKARYVRVTALRLWKRDNDYCFALAEMQVESKGKNVALGATVTSLDTIEAGRWSRKFLVDDCDSRKRLEKPSEATRAVEEKIEQAEKELTRLYEIHVDVKLREEIARNDKQLQEIERTLFQTAPPAKVYSILPRPPRPIHVLARGDVEKPGKEVKAGALALLKHQTHEFPNSEDEGERRLALAEWITHRDNVLTWRSIVNRVWHYHFGRGLVDTPNDFGGNGSKPTHPELLDWLACEFRDNGGSFKKLHKLILTSAAYRRSSRHDEANAKLDADNRYLWRMNRQRLDAESIRDSVLSVSGKLDVTMGGPGYDLFRFKDDHSPVYDHTSLEKIHDPKTYRRTVYRFTVRSVPNPFLDCLDCADPNINTPVRNATLTALQALSLLNNPFMVKQAEFFAERLKKVETSEGQIEFGYRLAFGRSPNKEERDALAAFAQKHGLPAACRLLLNANEFVFVD